jgi:hypothetical protein
MAEQWRVQQDALLAADDLSEAEIAAELDQQYTLYMECREAEIENAEIESVGRWVLPENIHAVNVYSACQWTIHQGMGPRYYQGISQLEIESAIRNQAIPDAQRKAVAQDVTMMWMLAQPTLQTAANAAAKAAEKG